MWMDLSTMQYDELRVWLSRAARLAIRGRKIWQRLSLRPVSTFHVYRLLPEQIRVEAGDV